MIKSFRHNGLENLFYEGSKKGIQAKHVRRLKDILDRLDAVSTVESMNYPGSDLHALKGDMHGFWAVKVSGNWRVTFAFYNGNAYALNYLDYH